MADRGLTGILLVGGASSRFGSPKALARFEVETLGECAWRLLGEVCDERIAVGRSDGLPFPALSDEGTGPGYRDRPNPDKPCVARLPPRLILEMDQA